MLKNIDIRSLAGERAYEKGRRYFERDAVGRIHETPLGEYIEYRAWVSDRDRLDTTFPSSWGKMTGSGDTPAPARRRRLIPAPANTSSLC